MTGSRGPLFQPLRVSPQIVRLDRTMEQIVFPVPSICEFLTKESKLRIYYTTERDEQGSKINDFFLRSEDLFNEMNWQKKLRGGWARPPRLRASEQVAEWVVLGVALPALVSRWEHSWCDLRSFPPVGTRMS